MKYYVYRFNKNSGFKFKRTKCNDYWTNDYSVCWQYSKQGAEKIVKTLNERRKNDLYMYGIIAVDEVEYMISGYEKEIDKQTHMAECMSAAPWWI